MANRAASLRQEQTGRTVTRRGKRFLEFDLGSGRRRYVTTLEPLHYGDGTQEIDTAFTADVGAFQWKMTAADFEVRTRDVLNSGNLVEFRKGAEFVVFNPLSLNWVNQDNSQQQISTTQAVSAQVTDDRIDWPAGFGAGRDFSYQAHPSRLIKLLTIQSAANLPAPTVTGPDIYLMLEMQFTNSSGVELWLDGVRWTRQANVRVSTANAIEFRSETTGEPIWRMDRPTATDANLNRVNGLLEVRRQGGNSIATIRFPRAWVQSAVFPIVLDPTLTLQPDDTAGKDVWIDQANPTTNQEGPDALYGSLFSSGRILRSVIEFDLSSIPGGATVDAATLTCWVHSGSGHGSTYPDTDIFRILSANSWNETQATWNNRLTSTAWTGSSGCGTSGTDYDATAIGTQTGGIKAVNTEMAITLSASGVEAMIATNRGVLIRGQDETVAQGTPFCKDSGHATSAQRPKLEIDYTEAGGGAATFTFQKNRGIRPRPFAPGLAR